MGHTVNRKIFFYSRYICASNRVFPIRSHTFTSENTRSSMPDLREQEIPPILASLFIQAVREGQTLWFRVASNSMSPLFQKDDSVSIVPATADAIRPGEIAAFETRDGLVIHRIIHRQQNGQTIRLLQMSDVDLFASWIEPTSVVGKVIAVRKEGQQANLAHPIAKWYGRIVATTRYQLYLRNSHTFLRLPWRGCSRLSLRFGYWCVRRICTSPVPIPGK